MSEYRIAFRCVATSETRECVSSDWKNLVITKNYTEIDGLMPWTKYELQITAHNEEGESPTSVSFATTLEIGM